MAKLIDHPSASGSAAVESTEDNSLTHPSWCAPGRCWAYAPGEDGEPEAGGYHESVELAVVTENPQPIRLQLMLDNGQQGAGALLVLTTGTDDDGTTRHLTLDQAEMLRAALDVLLPPRGYAGATVKAYELGIKQGQRQAERAALDDVAEAFSVGQAIEKERVNRDRKQRAESMRDTLDALQRIQKRLDDAGIERRKAYAQGFVDALDGRAPEFEVNR